MKEIIASNRFKKDIKIMKKRGHNLNKLEKIISFLVSDIPLKTKHKPHKLSGDYTGFWEYHIEPD